VRGDSGVFVVSKTAQPAEWFADTVREILLPVVGRQTADRNRGHMSAAHKSVTKALHVKIDRRHTEALLKTGALQDAIFNNLTNNAIKFTDKGTVRLEVANRLKDDRAFQKLATLLGGHITFASELGSGSTFTVVLPRKVA
jgi:hypothetical protein